MRLGGELSNNKGINKQGGGLTAPPDRQGHGDIPHRHAPAGRLRGRELPPRTPPTWKWRASCANVAAPNGTTSRPDRQDRAPEAIPTWRPILKASDGIMVARGDLAVGSGQRRRACAAKRMIKLAREHGQGRHHRHPDDGVMIVNPVPTRAEVSDVANAVLDGTDAVMLSPRRPPGKFPLETGGRRWPHLRRPPKPPSMCAWMPTSAARPSRRIDQTIAMGRCSPPTTWVPKTIVALTDSGSTALWMSRHRIHVIPIYALTPRVASQRKMALYRNVRPCSWTPAPTATPPLGTWPGPPPQEARHRAAR